MPIRLAFLAFTVASLLIALSLRAGVIVSQHSGAADPSTEGWTPISFGSAATAGPVVGDSGFNAWNVNDQGGNDFRAYKSVIGSANAQQALTQGFTTRARLRVLSPSTPASGVVTLEFITGVLAFLARVGSEADGDPILELQNDFGRTTLTAQGAGGGYHLYEMVYNPAMQLADVRVDGLHLGDYAGFHPVIAQVVPPPLDVYWGSTSSSGIGAANYNLVQMEVVPEPATALLLAVASIAISRRARRCRRASR
jgi:hypothetical protein